MNSQARESHAPGSLSVLEWSSELVSGVSHIDAQHRSILKEARDLLTAAQLNRADTVQRFDALISHVVGHFKDEENFLRLIQYPEADRHLRQHTMLLNAAIDLRGELHAGRAGRQELLEYLVNSLVNEHILVDDRAFFAPARKYLERSTPASRANEQL